MIWVEVVEVVAGAEAVPGAAVVVGRAAWVALKPPGQAANASALAAGTGCCTW